MRNAAIIALACLGVAWARPSLPRDEASTESCFARQEIDAGGLLQRARDASVAAPVFSFDANDCRAGTYIGRFACGTGPITMQGDILLTLAAAGAPTVLHAAADSRLRSDSASGGVLSAALEGVVDCHDARVDILVHAAYAESCAALPLEGYLSGNYLPAEGLLHGQLELFPDIDEVSLPVALQCGWCASLTAAECDPST